jgi:histidinol-phosphate aminotransferase
VTIAGPGPELFRPALEGLVPYEPGKPAELVQRELGLVHVVKLASNEGPFGPFPQAIEAIERSLAEANRYPDGGAYRLREALAARHGVAFEETVVAAGADAVIGYVCQATLDPGDEVVTPWPSFPSYVLDPLKLGAAPVRVPLRDGRIDVDDLLAAVTPRTKLAYLPTVNNPTGTMTARADFLRFLDGLPPEVLTVVDEAYFEYVDDPELPDAIEEAAKRGRHVLALRTFSKIYGLAGLRVGYGIAPADVVTATSKVRRAFDVTATAQAAALASLDDADELARRRAVNAEGRARLEGMLRGHGLEPAGPALGNFLSVEVGHGRDVFERLLREGVIVRPLAGFGAPEAIRITVGAPDELDLLHAALGHVLSGVSI